MRKLWLLVVCSLLMHVANAQDTVMQKKEKTRVYNTEVFVVGKKKPVTGNLASISDSSLYLSYSDVALKAAVINNKGIQKVNYDRVTSVKIRRKGTVGRGLLYGALIGLELA